MENYSPYTKHFQIIVILQFFFCLSYSGFSQYKSTGKLFVPYFLCPSFPAIQSTEPLHPRFLIKENKMMDKLEKMTNWVQWYLKYFPYPYASYSNETNWLFGLGKYNAFTLGKKGVKDSITQPSSINTFLYATLNQQYKVVIESNLMFDKNRALWKTTLAYVDYPLEFFGVGNETQLEDQRTFVTTDWQLSTQYLFKIWKNWYTGLVYDLYDYKKAYLKEDEHNPPNYIIDGDHVLGTQSGLGLKILMEERDNRLNARRGYFADVSYQVFTKAIGSQYDYNLFQADFRYYTPVYKKITLASQIHSEARFGDAPVQSISLLGGDYYMRGTYRGRYRDNVLLDGQLEFRFPIYWIIGGVIFSSIGQVAPTYKQMSFDAFHYNYGAGLRLQMDSEHDVNIRFDVGRSSDQTIFIINVQEAF